MDKKLKELALKQFRHDTAMDPTGTMIHLINLGADQDAVRTFVEDCVNESHISFNRDRDCGIYEAPFDSVTVIGVTSDTITVKLNEIYKRVLRLEEQDFGYADGPSFFVKDGESEFGSIGFSNFHPELCDPWWMWTINDPDMSEEMAKAEAKKEKLRTAVNMIKEIVASAIYSHWGYKPEYMRRVKFSGVKTSDVWNAFCTKEIEE